MLLTIAFILLLFWLIGVFLRAVSGVVHLLLLLAVVMLVLHIAHGRPVWRRGPRWMGTSHLQRWF